jgi:trk system potassium uptake protein TrkH
MANETERKISISLRLSHSLNPQRLLVLSFAILILIGAGTLLIPGMTGPSGISPVDALFTATSAVCVTGLVVKDTGSDFTALGQTIILIMIQLGGLGMMTFSIFFFLLLGRRASLHDELAVRSTFSHMHQQNTGRLVKHVLLLTFTAEALGALFLFLCWFGDHGSARAAWLAVFHSVSAFCNAGFSLWTDSLTGYKTHVWVNLVFIFLIVCGGLGFIVLSELGAKATKQRHRLSLHSKMVLWTSAGLIALCFAVFLHQEWDNVLKGMPLLDKITVSLFQSVTPRTAGFNSVEYAHTTNTTLVLTMFLMFIGGSPGSTAGGIKTINLAILVALAVSRYRGFSKVNIFRRSLPQEIVTRSLTITLVAISGVVLALIFLMAVQTGHLDHTQTRDIFLELLFEITSAFGTVGLSMGATAELTTYGKLIIIAAMFLGRVGPLTLALALLRRSEVGRMYNYGSEDIMVG